MPPHSMGAASDEGMASEVYLGPLIQFIRRYPVHGPRRPLRRLSRSQGAAIHIHDDNTTTADAVRDDEHSYGKRPRPLASVSANPSATIVGRTLPGVER